MVIKKSGSRLTHKFVQAVTRPGSYGDGRGGCGLKLVVQKRTNGRPSKSWVQRIRIDGKPRELGLGTFPVIILTQARDKARDNLHRVAQGEDIRIPPPKIPTLAEAFEKVITLRAPAWRGVGTKASWYRSLEYSERISSKPVSDATSSDILDVITPLWYEKPMTARTVRSHLSSVLDWCVTAGYRVTNPAGPGITKHLGKQSPETPHASLDYQNVGTSLAIVRDADIWWAAKYCLILLAFTILRNSEARLANWEEFNLDTATWTVPGSRMKNGIEHKVPLATQVMEILAHVRERSGRTHGAVFPSQSGRNVMDGARLSEIPRKLHIAAVPHGYRSSFRNWAGETPGLIPAAAEMVLAHKQPEPIVRRYLTTDFFKLRQPMMQQWADYLTETMGPVISTTRT